MQSIQQIEEAVLKLTHSDLVNFREWFDEFYEEAWDKQFEKDVQLGKLDSLASQAIADFKAGKCKEI